MSGATQGESFGLPEATEIWYLALAEPIGIVLRTSDVERTRQRLYQARQATGDDALSELQIRISPFPEGDLVIVHQRPHLSEAPL